MVNITVPSWSRAAELDLLQGEVTFSHLVGRSVVWAINQANLTYKTVNLHEQDEQSGIDRGVSAKGLPISSGILDTESLGSGDGDGDSGLEWELGVSESLLGIFANSAWKFSSESFSEDCWSELDEVLLLEGTFSRFLILIVLEHTSPSSKNSHDGFQISGVSPSFSRCLQWSRSRNTSDLWILDGSAHVKPSG